eukprot:jgi/Psemu1/42127/gm1.42127_g
MGEETGGARWTLGGAAGRRSRYLRNLPTDWRRGLLADTRYEEPREQVSDMEGASDEILGGVDWPLEVTRNPLEVQTQVLVDWLGRSLGINWKERLNQARVKRREVQTGDQSIRIYQGQAYWRTNTRAVSLKEETKELNRGGGSTRFRDPEKTGKGKEAGRLSRKGRPGWHQLKGINIQSENTDLSLKTRMTRARRLSRKYSVVENRDRNEQIAKSICPQEGTDCKEHLARKRKSKDMRTPIPEDRKDPKMKRRTLNPQETIFQSFTTEIQNEQKNPKKG